MKNKFDFAEFLYRFRWLASAVCLLLIIAVLANGIGKVGTFSGKVESLKELDSSSSSKPKVFDSRFDIWFPANHPGVRTFNEIEDQFIAEDYLLIAFEEPKHPLGVFSPASLATIARLTDKIQRIPYVRHVRSLTANPWIRWQSSKTVGAGAEKGQLVISDLFEDPPPNYSEAQVVKRMVAVLGARQTAEMIGEARVREAIGAETAYSDHIGEPRLHGNIISSNGRTTAIQVQILRSAPSASRMTEDFGDDDKAKLAATAALTNDLQYQALDDIRGVLAEEPDRYVFHMGGMIMQLRHMEDLALADMKYVGLMFVLILISLIIIFHHLLGPLAALAVTTLSILGLMGFIFAMGDLLNNMTAITPTMLTAVGLADSIHLVASYFILRGRYGNRRELIIEVVRRNALPLLLTSLTTAIGFYSMVISEVVPLHMLGYSMGTGVVIAYLATMTLIPALFSLLPIPGEKAQADPLATRGPDRDASRVSTGFNWLAECVVRRRKQICALSVLLMAIAAVGASTLRLDSSMREMFPDDDPMMTDFIWIDDHLGGVGDVELVFSAPAHATSGDEAYERESQLDVLRSRQLAHSLSKTASVGLTTEEQAKKSALEAWSLQYNRRRIAVAKEFLQEVVRFELWLEKEIRNPESPVFGIITRVESPLDVLRKMHQVQNQNLASYYRLPTLADVNSDARKPAVYVDEVTDDTTYIPAQNESTLAAQYFLQYENGAKPTESLATIVSPNRRFFRLRGRVKQGSSGLQASAFRYVLAVAQRDFPRIAGTDGEVAAGKSLAKLTISGRSVLFANMMGMFTRTLLQSLVLAACAITLVIIIVFRSFLIGLVSLVPNLLPVFIPLTLFGFLDITLSAPAVVSVTVALGVCVDDTIHFLASYVRAKRSGLSNQAAVQATFDHVGGAITTTTVVLMCGFGVLALSSFKPNQLLGQLAVSMFGLAWLADFIITPAMLSLLPESFFSRGQPITEGNHP